MRVLDVLLNPWWVVGRVECLERVVKADERLIGDLCEDRYRKGEQIERRGLLLTMCDRVLDCQCIFPRQEGDDLCLYCQIRSEVSAEERVRHVKVIFEGEGK